MYSYKINKILKEEGIEWDGDDYKIICGQDVDPCSDADIRCALEDWLIKERHHVVFKKLIGGRIKLEGNHLNFDGISPLDCLLKACEEVA